MDARLPTKIWVDALIRRAETAGAAGFIVQSGDESRGDVLVKVSELNGSAHAYVPGMGMEGERIFVDLQVQNIGPDEKDVDAYLAKARARDRDLWVIEIEDTKGRHFLTEEVQTIATEY